MERHQGRRQRVDGRRRRAGQGPQRLQPRGRRSVADARGPAARQRQPVWFCGHSLGGAMATICAYRCKTVGDREQSQELHTFGSPRGAAASGTFATPEVTHYRWVHNNDIVTRVPPVRGWAIGIAATRSISTATAGFASSPACWRSRDRWRGFVGGLLMAARSCWPTTASITTRITSQKPPRRRTSASAAARPRRPGSAFTIRDEQPAEEQKTETPVSR